MAKRHEQALAIQNPGACNPCGIALTIVEAVRETRDEGKNACKDAAVRLMVHQLASICNIGEIDISTDGLDVYRRLTEECVERANEPAPVVVERCSQ